MKLVRSFIYAAQGFAYCIRHELNFRIHLLATIVVVLMGVFLHCSNNEWLILLIHITLVLSFEMFNTAIERISNQFGTGKNGNIKIIKDVSAGAVLLAATTAIISAAIIFVPKIIYYFS